MKKNKNSLENKDRLERLGVIIIIFILWIKLWYIDISLSNKMIEGYELYNNLLKMNIINSIIINIIIILSLIYIILYIKKLTGIYILDKNIQKEKRMIILIILNMLGITMLILTNDIMLLYILIEYQSFIIYIITCIYKESSRAITSSLYYFIIGSIGSLIILDGSVSLYENISLSNISYIELLLENWKVSSLSYSLVIIILGLLWKMGIGPLYNYLIIIYTYVPTIITNYISLIPKVSILYLILIIINIISMLEIMNINNINNMLYIILGLSMLIGSLGGLNEINIKKILGYSSLLNISYILINIITNNNLSNRSYIIYIIQYSITHINIFSILLILPIYMCYNYINIKNNKKVKENKKYYNIILNKYSPIEYINQLNDLYIKNKYLFICLSISLFSLIGIPPLIGFYGKYLILISLLNSGVIYLSIMLIIVSTISTVYYLSIIKILTFNIKETLNINIINNNLLNYNNKENKYTYNNNIITLIISLSTIIILFINIIIKRILRGTNYLVTLYLYNN